MPLFTNSMNNPKTRKLLDAYKIEGVILHLAPNTLATNKHTVCAWSTAGCRAMCLNTSGMSRIKGELTHNNLIKHHIHLARINKTLMYLKDRSLFVNQLVNELLNLECRAIKKGYKPVARLNGTSDIPWEGIKLPECYTPQNPNKQTVIDEFRLIQFYDYTKSIRRMDSFLSKRLPNNYHLTFSRSEKTTPDQVHKVISKGGNVAVVFRKEIPHRYQGIKVINGDKHDFRYMDEHERIVGLTAKGRAKHDTTGFVVG